MIREIVKNALALRQVSPEVLASVDTLLARSIIRLQKDNLLPSRRWEFICKDQKQEYIVNDKVLYTYFYLPDDFRVLDEFRPLETYPYAWVADEHQLYNNRIKGKKFTIVDTNFDDESDYEKILIVSPTPKEDERIQIKYYVNGKNINFDWIGEQYWEAVIMDVEQMLGLRSIEEADEHLTRAVSQNKEHSGHRMDNRKKTIKGTFFGRR